MVRGQRSVLPEQYAVYAGDAPADFLAVSACNEKGILLPYIHVRSGVTGPDGMIDASKGHVGADLFAMHGGQAFQFSLDLTSLSYAHLGERMANNGLANLRLTIADLIVKSGSSSCPSEK